MLARSEQTPTPPRPCCGRRRPDVDNRPPIRPRRPVLSVPCAGCRAPPLIANVDRMPNPDDALVAMFAEQRGGVLITIKRDGRPQASVVAHAFDTATRTVRVSVTADRAKTRNLRRDPRASYQVIRPDLGAYAVGEGIAELTPTAADPHDATVEALVELYRTVGGEHPDWDEYRAAMVADGRLVLTLPLQHIYGWAGIPG
jgi:PPOX class probable F420-dependent enzyme